MVILRANVPYFFALLCINHQFLVIFIHTRKKVQISFISNYFGLLLIILSEQ